MRVTAVVLVMLCIMPSAIAAEGKARAPAVVNVQDLGAKADGKTDAAAAIQRAIDSVGKAGGGVVHFPRSAKPYLVGRTIRIVSSKVQLSGYGATIKLADRAGDGRTVDVMEVTGKPQAPVADVVIKGLTIDGNYWAQSKAGNPRGIDFDYAVRARVQDVQITRAYVGMTFGKGCQDCTATKCVVTRWHNDGFNASGDGVTGGCKEIRFIECHARNAPNERNGGLPGRRDGAWEIEDGVDGVYLTRCSVKNAGGHGFSVKNHMSTKHITQNVVFTDCRATDTRSSGFQMKGYLRNRNIRLVNCYSNRRVYMKQAPVGVVISGGRFDGGMMLTVDRFRKGGEQGVQDLEIRNVRTNHIEFYGSNVRLINVTLIGKGGRGIQVNEHSSNVSLIGCTLTRAGEAIHCTNVSPRIVNCIVWDNKRSFGLAGSSHPAISHSCIQGGVPAAAKDEGGNISADPRFVNASAGDCRLKSGSPCIGKGLAFDRIGVRLMTGKPTDIAGRQRPSPTGTNPDMGASENVLLSAPAAAAPPREEARPPAAAGIPMKTRAAAVVVNVRDLGAKADGKTDDTRAIQKAINQVGAKGGGRVLLPPAKQPYMISSTLVIGRDNVEFYGPGATIQMVDNANRGKGRDSLYIGGSGRKPLRGVVVRGLTIDTNIWKQPKARYPRGLLASYVTGLLIEKVTVKRAGVALSFGKGATHSEARDCLVTQWHNDGFNVTGDRRGGVAHAHHIKFIRCRAADSRDEADGGPPGKRDNAWEIEDGCHDVEFIDCVAENASGRAFGLRNHGKKRDHRPCDTHSFVFTRCRVTNMGSRGWWALGGGRYDDSMGKTDPQVTIRNVKLIDCQSDTTCSFLRGARDIQIIGGKFTAPVLFGMDADTEPGRRPPAQAYGISVSGGGFDVLKANLTPGKVAKRAVIRGTGPIETVAEQPTLALNKVRVRKTLEIFGKQKHLTMTDCVLPKNVEAYGQIDPSKARTPEEIRAAELEMATLWRRIKKAHSAHPHCVAYYTFEKDAFYEANGVTKVKNMAGAGERPEALDAVVHGHGRFSPKAGRFPGKGGMGWDGNTYIVVPDDPRLRPEPEGAIEFWMLYNKTGGYCGLVENLKTVGDDDFGYQLLFNNRSRKKRVYWFAGSGTGSGKRRWRKAGALQSMGTWAHYVFTWRNRDNRLDCYRDGKSIGTIGNKQIPFKGVRYTDEKTPLYIGGTSAEGSGHPPSPDFDAVAIYNKFLSAKEVGKLHGAGKPLSPRVTWSANKQ